MTVIGGVRSATTATTTSCEAAAVSPAQPPVRVADDAKLFCGPLHCHTANGVYRNSVLGTQRALGPYWGLGAEPR